MEALKRLHPGLNVYELDLTYIAGHPVYLTTETPMRTALVSTGQAVQIVFNDALLKLSLAKAIAPYSISESRMVTQYESYYMDRAHRKRLPALYIRLDDTQRTVFYIDLA
jgi:hypothetical protein